MIGHGFLQRGAVWKPETCTQNPETDRVWPDRLGAPEGYGLGTDLPRRFQTLRSWDFSVFSPAS